MMAASTGRALNSPLATWLLALLQIAAVWSIWHGAVGHHGPLWSVIGLLLLAGYGFLMAFRDRRHFGATVAVHGGALVVGALVWGAVVDGFRPDRWDGVGSALILVGAAVLVSRRRRGVGRPGRPQ